MEGASGALQNAIATITAPCIGLFFMVSGALLLPCGNSLEFYSKRFSKVLIPTLFWILFYIAANVIILHQDVAAVPGQIFSIPFSTQGHGVMWFMYVLCGLYLITPIISPWLKAASKKELQIVLGVWGITLLFPLLEQWLKISTSVEAPLYYFAGYAGYFVLGFYLTKYSISLSWSKLVILTAIIFGCFGVIRFVNTGIDFGRSTSYLSLLVALQTILYYIVLEKLFKGRLENSNWQPFVAKLSNLCFGVYLVHIFFIRYLLNNFMAGSAKQILITVLITTLCSFVVSYLISLLPFAKYIIGYRSTKRKTL